MPDQKISQLTAIVTVDNSADVLPIVDISANTTKKVTPTQLKTALALDNVNNTSDANKPVSTAQQDALNAKVSSNAAITPGTSAKITFDAKGLVTAGNSLDETDLPTGINANKIGTGVVSTTEFEYLNGVTSAIQTQIDSKQATLVSGTNIKTINSTSLLGSGDITISANPSGVAGAIQFSNGSAFASDAANLFWDDTNNRLGIGTNAPTSPLQVAGTITTQNLLTSGVIYGGSFWLQENGILALGQQSAGPSKFFVKGSGSTSATTSLLVQNSAGTAALTVKDDCSTNIGASGISARMNFINTNGSVTSYIAATGSGGIVEWNSSSGSGISFYDGYGYANMFVGGGLSSGAAVAIGKNTAAATSSVLEVASTTKGFLPPRMTTTQKNAIATPAAGLVIYDTTLAKLCVYTTTWETITSL